MQDQNQNEKNISVPGNILVLNFINVKFASGLQYPLLKCRIQTASSYWAISVVQLVRHCSELRGGGRGFGSCPSVVAVIFSQTSVYKINSSHFNVLI